MKFTSYFKSLTYSFYVMVMVVGCQLTAHAVSGYIPNPFYETVSVAEKGMDKKQPYDAPQPLKDAGPVDSGLLVIIGLATWSCAYAMYGWASVIKKLLL